MPVCLCAAGGVHAAAVAAGGLVGGDRGTRYHRFRRADYRLVRGPSVGVSGAPHRPDRRPCQALLGSRVRCDLHVTWGQAFVNHPRSCVREAMQYDLPPYVLLFRPTIGSA